MKQLFYIFTLITTLISVPAVGLNQTSADFALLDSFDGFNNGSINTQGDWVGNDPGAPDGALVSAAPPAWFSGKAFHNNPDSYPNRGNAYRKLNSNAVNGGETKTFYFQISVDDLANSDFSVGLTDESQPDIFAATPDFQHFEAEFNISQNGLKVLNGNSMQGATNFTLHSQRLIHVWLVVDHSANQFELHTDDAYGGRVQISTSSGSSFSFRNGNSSGNLVTFVLQNKGLNTSDSYLDNLYVATGKNLSYPAGNFQVVDTFESRNLGSVNGQNSWNVVQGSGNIINDPAQSGNKALSISGVDTVVRKGVAQISNGNTGTLYFRMYRNGTLNKFVGLSDQSTPANWDDYEVQFGFQAENPNDYRIRNGSGFTSAGSGDNLAQTWMCVWLVPQTQTDKFEVYAQGGPFEQATRLSAGGQSSFDFRNGAAASNLSALLIKTGPGSTGSLYLDDIFIDQQNKNLTRPNGACPESDGGGTDPGGNQNDPIDNPIPGSIQADGTTVRAQTIATVPATGSGPRTRINYLYHAKDGSNRLFVNDLRGEIFVINPDSGAVSEYLNVADYFTQFKTSGSLNAGLSTFAFHPDFATNGKLYTVHYENPNGTADFGHLNTNQPNPTHSVIVEWTASNPSSNSYSGSQPREVMRLLQATALHGVQLIEFNRTANPGSSDYGKLYISIGDSEQEPFFSGVSQHRSYPQGKILRIDPFGNNSANGKYGIPADNPFANSNDGTLKEIYAIGFRNPIRFDWDPVTKMMLTSVIGQNNIEEVELVEPGRNYGWNEREGTFRFDTSNPGNVYPIPNDDNPNFTYPVAQYDHDEGFAIIGGFIYRGSLMPDLYGSYIFGDIVKGHLFYTKIDDIQLGQQAPIHKLTLLDGNGNPTTFNSMIGASRGDLRFGLDAAGEIYIMSKQDGVVRKLYSDEAPSNESPQISSPGNWSSKVGDSVTLQINASDPDGDDLSFSAENLPDGLSINDRNGLISGTPSKTGTYRPKIHVNDGQGGSNSVEFTWTISQANATATPISFTPTPGQTTTPQNTATPISTATPTQNPGETPTSSVTPSVTPTGTVIPTIDPQVTPMPTSTPIPGASPTPTPTTDPNPPNLTFFNFAPFISSWP